MGQKPSTTPAIAPPIPHARTFLTSWEAARVAEVTPPTVIAWCTRFGIGRRVGTRWRIDAGKLHSLLSGGTPDGTAIH